MSVVSDGYQIPGHSSPSNLPVSISLIAKTFQILVKFQPPKNNVDQGMPWVHFCYILSLSHPFYQSYIHYVFCPLPSCAHNVSVRALLCPFFICFFIPPSSCCISGRSVTVRDAGILLPRGRRMAQKLYSQLIITIYTRNTSHSSNGTLNFV